MNYYFYYEKQTRENSVKMNTMIAIPAFGASAPAINTSLVLSKMDAGARRNKKCDNQNG
jgi:hypothetical protein